MKDRLNELRKARARLASVLRDYEVDDGVKHAAGDDLDDPANDITEERKTTIRHTIEQLDREIAQREGCDAQTS